ncbi:MAG: NUDIX domain-containing protein [Methanobacteriota archaeon]|nr:MAG: NUDIX domain-containing protein [Euryarchaeota archaeon]
MAKKRSRGHVFVETDGQVFLVRERGKYRFPRADEGLPFRTDPNGIMDFGEDRVVKRTPRLDHHPEEWMGRDSVFERTDIDPLVKRAIYTTMIRCVSEVILSKGPRVLMVKAVRGYSKGYWNIPGGFMDYGEGPEAGAEREAMEEIGTEVALDGLLNVYVSGFPGKPAYTLGFVYKGHLKSDRLRLKADEIEDAAWFTVDKGLTLTRNPFAKWGLVDFFLQSPESRRALRVKRHGLSEGAKGIDQPTVFLDRDGVINRGRAGYVRTPDHFEFLPGAIAGMRLFQEHGWRLVIVTNQDASGWKLVPERQLRCCSRPRGTSESAPGPRGWWATSLSTCKRVGPSDAASRGSGRRRGEGVSPRKSGHGLRTWSQTASSRLPRRSYEIQKSASSRDSRRPAPLRRQTRSLIDRFQAGLLFDASGGLSLRRRGTLMLIEPRCKSAWTYVTRSGSSVYLR